MVVNPRKVLFSMDYERIRQQLAEAATVGRTEEAVEQVVTSEQPVESTRLAVAPQTASKRRRAAKRARRATSSDATVTVPGNTATTNRHAIRQLALLALFELDVTSHPFEEVVQRVIDDPFLSADSPYGEQTGESELELPPEAVADTRLLEQGVRDLVFGVIRFTAGIDATIVRTAPAYPIDRIGPIDRNVLRLGIYELEYVRAESIPEVVNEAVELGKRFGGDSTAAFVNGVLRTISDEIRAAEQ